MENAYFYSDLALERRRADITSGGVEYRKQPASVGEWEKIRITNEDGAHSIGRPIGNYNTLSLPRIDMLDDEEAEDAQDEIARGLCELCSLMAVAPRRILAVGLGNRSLTPDALGSMTAENIRATMHIKNFDEDIFDELFCSEIAVLCPSVSGVSGMESADVVKAVAGAIKPDLIIVIDAIAASSEARLGSSIQLSDTGIFPGGGVGNRQKGITESSAGAPVIAIGMPTVINSKLLSENISKGMFVIPREIDAICQNAAKIIGGAINQAFGI